ncbi:MAG: exo-beta-N-acetylmuramidase NamZ family protein, partial [Flavobacteriales bacterium]
MAKIKQIFLLFSLLLSVLSYSQIKVAAEITKHYLPLLKQQKVAIIGNQSSLIKNTHLVDSLLSLNIDIVKVFSPEHGFRGTADAGAKIEDGIDVKTGIPIISLYGKNKKPYTEQLAGIDILLFDIQDVGARFYTYISTLHYVMEAAAENNIKVIVLDRPNPNGHYVDGPIREKGFESFVGMHPIPIVHGMTIGEYAKMINGENWISEKCDLTIIKMENYTHDM